jgi:hypothetical protein
LPLERYAGTYVDSTYGALEVTFVNGALRARFGAQDLGTLEPWEHESFRAVGPPPAMNRIPVTFVPDGAGGIASVRALGLTFQRLPAARRPGA